MKQAKPATKSLNLPKPVANYFTADKGDGEAVSQCFADNAVVKDEGHTHRGRAAIKEWKTDASAKYEYTCEPIACEEKEGKTVVTSHLVGNFPGSPVDLRFFFKLEGDKIASLEIIPRGMASKPSIHRDERSLCTPRTDSH
jgi:SnoaL-like domain